MERTDSQSGIYTATPEDTASFRPQLFQLGAVLNGLETGAGKIHRRIGQVMAAVKSGTYEIDPVQLSRRIVGDTLRRCPETR